MNGERRRMSISSAWLQVAILTFICGFAVLGYLARVIRAQHPPVPQEVRGGGDGDVLFTGQDIMEGQHLFQKYGLMQFGTLFGHGAYLGPDFTAQYLHQAGEVMQKHYVAAGLSLNDARARVQADFKTNQYDPKAGTLLFTPAQAAAFERLTGFYRDWFGPPEQQAGMGALQRPHIKDADEIHDLTSYFAWAAWTCAAQRPGADYSYTNTWPPEPMAGNLPTSQAFLWSVFSLVALLGGIGIIMFVF